MKQRVHAPRLYAPHRAAGVARLCSVVTTPSTVQAGVAGALRNLSASEATRQAIVAAGGMEALSAAAQLHADNERLQAEVAGALRNLAGEA